MRVGRDDEVFLAYDRALTAYTDTLERAQPLFKRP
jgi:hypothetical protein